MSRGFVKEEDQEEIPMIPPRAPLPSGSVNYVTPAGYNDLLQEKDELETERRELPKNNEAEHRRSTMFIDGKLKLLNERIASARVLSPKDQPKEEVRFGALVELQNGRRKQKFQIVGVDEADVKKKKIAFTAPIARAITGKKVNESVPFHRGKEVQNLKILKIDYSV